MKEGAAFAAPLVIYEAAVVGLKGRCSTTELRPYIGFDYFTVASPLCRTRDVAAGSAGDRPDEAGGWTRRGLWRCGRPY